MYQVLYRKYRPKVFSDVYGQDHVTSTLQNEIKNNRISHAYLFTGSRGTGKTTCAKILAKAINCPNSHDGEPCNECEICRAIENGSINDVVEIDAASNRKVDDIRELRDSTNYTPSTAKYRVFIIDEVHMLTPEAFNALLKTLEEPPEHVIFILATTDIHKVIPTIRSRCQRFDFKRIQPETMAIRLQQVSAQEGLTLEEDAAVLIARIADGALRDGLSILDQCASRSKSITPQLVSEVSGLAGKETLYQLSDCITHGQSSEAMEIISELYQNSYDMEQLCVEMINHFRNLLVMKTVRKSRPLMICTDDEYERIAAMAEDYTLENVIYSLDLFQDTLVKIKGGAAARIELEMALIKLCEPKLERSESALLDRLAKVERAIKTGAAALQQVPAVPQTAAVSSPSTAETPSVPSKPEPPKPEPVIPAQEKTAPPEEDLPPFDMDGVKEKTPKAPAPEPVLPSPEEPLPPTSVTTPPLQQSVTVPQQETTVTGRLPFTQWGDFIDEIKKSDISLFSVLNGAKAYVEGDRFFVDSPNKSLSDFIKIENRARTIKQALLAVTGKPYRLFIVKHDSTDQPKRDPLEDLIRNAGGRMNIDVK
ncbi:MAG: DNA polymerase III subunit gamma/tau [Eubacterium sp.]|nr:DNA polymerase III subunit gamma/tau [Eubacterium sp.]